MDYVIYIFNNDLALDRDYLTLNQIAIGSCDRIADFQDAAMFNNPIKIDAEKELNIQDDWNAGLASLNLKRESDRDSNLQTVTIKMNVAARYEIELEYSNNENSTISQQFWSSDLQIELVSQSINEPISLFNLKNKDNWSFDSSFDDLLKLDRNNDPFINNSLDRIKQNTSVDALTGVAVSLPESQAIAIDSNSKIDLNFNYVTQVDLDNYCDRLLPLVPNQQNSISHYKPKRKLVAR